MVYKKRRIVSIEFSMEKQRAKGRLSRTEWVREALDVLQERGVDGVKIVVIANRLGVTTGSFYWHFKDLPELLDCILEFWECELTDTVIVAGKSYSGSPEDRILRLMLQVIEHDAGLYDPAIHVWARSDQKAKDVFERTLRKRFDFARWMFKQAGFSDRQAKVRGRLMVAYLMGESAADLRSKKSWRRTIKDEHAILMSNTA